MATVGFKGLMFTTEPIPYEFVHAAINSNIHLSRWAINI